MTDFRVGHLTINIRNARLVGPTWNNRSADLVRWIKARNVSVVSIQECNGAQFVDLKGLFGPDWKLIRSQNCVVAYRVDKYVSHLVIRETLVGPQSRGFVAVVLECIRAQRSWFIVGSGHLTVNRPDSLAWRKKQVYQVSNIFSALILQWVAAGFDLNSTSLPPKRGAREYFRRHGLVHLRGRLRVSQIIGAARSTFQGFGITRENGRWLDDILTGKFCKPYRAAVCVTDLTDHNGVRASYRVYTKNQMPVEQLVKLLDRA